MNKKKKIIMSAVIIAIIVLLSGVLSIKKYISKVPKLTVKGQRIVEAGQILELSDIVDVECKGDYRLELAIDSEIDDAEVSKDMQSLYVGSKSGNIRVTITGYGEVAEHVSEETIIHVSLGEIERKEMKERAVVIARKADAYITSTEEYHNITLEQAIYNSRIYYDDKQEVISLDMKYKKDNGSDLYIHVEYGVVNGEDKFGIGERNLFETLSYVVSGKNDAFINLGDDVYARLHDVSSDGDVFELNSYEYMFLIDID